MIDPRPREPDWARRRWLAGMTLAGLGALGAGSTPARPTTDAAALDAIRRRLEEAKLEFIGTNETAHYVAIGDAPDEFRGEALKVCEGLATTFQNHLLTKGIEVSFPARKMAVVVLASKASYEAYNGEEAGDHEGGIYDVNSNLLVIFKTDKPLVNTFTLVHEATHQLTYNTGLLSRHGDVPVAVSEGFATYGEVWRKDRATLSRPNELRLRVFKTPGFVGPEWIPVARLITEDQLFADPATEQLAYAESCLLISNLLRMKESAAILQTYLALVRTRRFPDKRLADAEKAFGNLDRFDAELKRSAIGATRKLR